MYFRKEKRFQRKLDKSKADLYIFYNYSKNFFFNKLEIYQFIKN